MAIVLASSFLFFPALAQETAEEESTPRPKDLFRIDDVVEISAPVSGDLYALGREMILRGDVDGDILAVGQSVTILGNVGGDVRVAAETVTVSGAVEGSVTMLGRTLTTTTTATIGRNTTFFGGLVDVGGILKGDLSGRASDVRLRGSVDGDVRIHSGETVEFFPSAVVNGGVTVTSTAPLVRQEGAIIRGAVNEQRPSKGERQEGWRVFLFSRVVSFFSILLLGLVAVHLFRRPSLAIVSSMITSPLGSLWKGVLLFFVPPLAALLLFFTFIGVPLALIIGVLWGILLYSARVFTGLAIGLQILWHFDRKRRVQSILWPLCLGLFALVVLESIPVVGFLVTIVATWLGLGGMVIVVQGIRTSIVKKA